VILINANATEFNGKTSCFGVVSQNDYSAW